ncbi:hypothetical protein GPA07_13740 [Bacillus sp. ms-22]|uniref:hypothetical protein n=1 Tax=Bacillus sp. ms-22 TaxID=2683680 RepID=UPI0012FBD154|nr:hypothetical protein [Bacillus sp. ms-22]QGX66462.1 hypothetical protein GPA07_13740 [Bacillus sp. ms-22]
MNWMELVSSVINSIAWPMAIVLIIFFLKKSIKKLLDDVVSIKYGNIEIIRELKDSADRVTKNTNDIVDSVGVDEKLVNQLSNSSKTIEQLNNQLDQKVFDLYTVGVKPDHDISTNNFKHQIKPITYYAGYLFDKGIITEEIYKVIEDLNDLYDKLNFNKTYKYAKEKYQENARKIIAVLDNKIKEIQSKTSNS